MIKESQVKKEKKRALEYFRKAGIVLTPKEKESIEIAEYDMGKFDEIGLVLLTYFNTGRSSARELVLFPYQTCPEHYHPPFEYKDEKNIGKEETFRCRYGTVYLYVEGPSTKKPKCKLPKGRENYFTVFHEVVLEPGDQYTLYPGTKHWFQAGPKGAVVSEFSTRIKDEADVFVDPDVKRFSRIIPG